WNYALPASALTDGLTYTVHARATDTLGTVGNTASNAFTYDTTAPTVTVDQPAGQDDPTNGQPIHFTATFSEPVTGFGDDDVTLGGTANHGSATVHVSGTGPTYDIAVSGLGDGTVTATIGSNKAQDAAGNGNAASTNLDNSVLLDTVAPASEASSPAYSTASDSASRVDYAAFDSSSQGSGVKRVELWVKVPGGDWELLDTDTAPLADHIDYTPADGDGRYRFYTIAVDNAGNREIAPGEPDAVTEKVDTNTLRD